MGPGYAPGTSNYQISLRLFRDCNVPCGEGTNVACLPERGVVAIYSAASPYARIRVPSLPLTDSNSITLTTYPVCAYYKPPVCYEIKTYSDTITLADNNEGYVLAWESCCRALSQNQFGVAFTAGGLPGATYTAIIPGKNILNAGHNNSPVFKLKDTSLVCAGSKVAIDFSADDPDGDSLSYAFAAAYDGGYFWDNKCIIVDNMMYCDFTYAKAPPYDTITYNYAFGYSGVQPLGPGVSINAATGLINGVAPEHPGRYIVNVEVYEWRNGKRISSHQKDFIIRAEDCGIPLAKLEPSYLTCDGFGVTFQNESTSALINSYYWDFGDAKNALDTSTDPTPVYNYPDSGEYTVTLITNKGGQCSDTATTVARIYPGFVPGFKTSGGCISSPYQFTDLTQSKYGVVNSWRWDFGEYGTTADSSTLKNPKYAYHSPQQTSATLIVGDDKGCLDTILRPLTVFDKTPLQLAFKDTLICIKDSVRLSAVDSTGTTATYSWTPVTGISDPNISNPVVYPKTTTVYHIDVHDNGCTSSDSVTVNVISSVSLSLRSDTTICLGDQVQLSPQTNALYFTWSPSTGLDDAFVKNPLAQPLTNTSYQLTASVGGCTASGSTTINVVPYPQVVAGADSSICFSKTVQLHAKTNAPYFAWSPANSLSQANTLTPIASPVTTTNYIITVTDNKGCPKPFSDTTVITVIPAVPAFAGHDTTIVANQPLQLNATGGTSYTWSPATGMNDPFIANPVVTLGTQYDSMIYHVVVRTADCSAGDDIKVVVFKTLPDIFVPSAFTPNNDGHNDIMRPKLVGMKQFNYFRIYNRLGQMVFNTSTTGQGWDGNVSGVKQPVGTYVYMLQATDYTGKVLNRKGTFVLIR